MRRENKNSLSKKYLYISISILVLIFISIAIRLTPLTHSYWVNYVTAFLINNIFSLILMCISAFIVFLIDVKKYNRDSEEGDGKHGR